MLPLNSIGVFLQDLKTENKESWKQMAERIGTNAPLLSAVCHGAKRCPAGWDNKITSAYKLNDEKRRKLIGAIVQSNNNINAIYENLNDSDKSDVLTIANFYDALSPKEKKAILGIISGELDI